MVEKQRKRQRGEGVLYVCLVFKNRGGAVVAIRGARYFVCLHCDRENREENSEVVLIQLRSQSATLGSGRRTQL